MDISNRKHYIFIVSDLEDINYQTVAAYDILIHRLDNGIWGLNKYTRNRRNIQGGDRVIFYVAGTKFCSQHFVASAKVDNLPSEFKEYDLPKYVKIDEWLYDIPIYKLTISNIEYFKNPVDIYSIKNRMDLFKHFKSNNWGVFFQGGVRPVDKQDYGLIISESRRLVK